MISKDFVRSELGQRCQTLRNSISIGIDKLDAHGLQQRLGAIKLLNSFEMLCEWYLLAVDSRPQKTDRDLSIASKTLYDEFEKIRGIITEALSPVSFPAIPLLNQFVKSVIESLNQEFFKTPETIFIQESSKFALTRFYYCPDDVVRLYVPGDALSQPWRWSMIWHEMGNLLVFPIVMAKRAVRIGDRDSDREWVNSYYSVRKQINDFTNKYQKEDNLLSDDLLGAVIPKIWSGIGSNHKVRVKKTILHNWIEELLEDAVTILVLGPTGYMTLLETLNDFYQDPVKVDEERHPPPLLRLTVASAIIDLTNTQKISLSGIHDSLATTKMNVELIGANKQKVFDSIEKITVLLSQWIVNSLTRNLVDQNALWFNNATESKDIAGIGGIRAEAIKPVPVNQSNISAQMFLKKAMDEQEIIVQQGVTKWFLEQKPAGVLGLKLPDQQRHLLQTLQAELEVTIPVFADDNPEFRKQISALLYYNYNDLMDLVDTQNAKPDDIPDILTVDSKFLNLSGNGTIFETLTSEQLNILAFSYDDPDNVICPGCNPRNSNCIRFCSRRCCRR